MAPYAIGFGILLTALGAWGYFGAEEASRSATALIPAFVGVALALLGALALQERLRKHAMHAAAALALLGFLAAAVRIVMKLAKDGNLDGRGPLALVGMAVLCGVFVALCVGSFRAARRARENAGTPS